MVESATSRDRTTRGWVGTIAICLIGILILTVGYTTNQRAASYTGLAITLVGVLSGIIRLVAGPGTER